MADNSGLIISALEKTDPTLAQEIDAANSWQAQLLKGGARVALFRNYEIGDHRAKVTDEMLKMLRVTAGDDAMNDFAINQCESVISKEAALIFVSAIIVDDSAKDWLAETLTRNSFDARQVEDTNGALRDGNAYTMVGTDALWTSEPAYDGYSGMVVIYSSKTRLPIWACKLWSEAILSADEDDDAPNVQMKIIVYQNKNISYWVGEASGAEVTPDPSESPPTKPWPLGRIPIVAYVNRGKNYTKAGQSELRNVISPQDMLNRSLHSMMAATELGGFPIRWSIGAEIDVEGMVIGGVVNLAITNADGSTKTEYSDSDIEFLKTIETGQYEAVAIPPFLEVMNSLVIHIGFVSQTPLLGVTISGGISGDALRQLNAGLVSKASRYTQQNTDAYKLLIHLTADMQNAFDTGLGKAPEIDTVGVIWKDVEIMNVDERIATFTALREKAPNLFSSEFYIKEVGALLGMSQDAIDEEVENSKNNQGMLLDSLNGADGSVPAVGASTTGLATEQTPENIASDKGLNGAQIKAASDLFKEMTAGNIASGVVTELLVSIGIDKALAEQMVAEQIKIRPSGAEVPAVE